MKEEDRLEGLGATGGHLRRDRGVTSSERGVGTLVSDVAVLRLLEPGRMLTRRATLDHALDPHRLERPSVLDRSSERLATVRTVECQHEVSPLAPAVAVAGRQARV
jgi:hypothetical protein